MKKFKVTKVFQRHSLLIVFIGLFVGAGGIALLIATHALPPTASLETENGQTSGGAIIISDAGASGGAAIKFTFPKAFGALTRYTGNPLVRNGPQAYDDLKAGPRVVLKLGTGNYKMWYEAVSTNGITSVAHATSTDGLTWQKQGVVMSPTLGWEKSEVSPNSILIENGVYRMWYHAGGYPGSGGQRLGSAEVGYATSSDGGLTWSKRATPVLNIGAVGSYDANQAAEPRVFNLSGTYRMYYTAVANSGAPTSLSMATSPDGITWTKYANNPIISTANWGGFWGGAFFYENGTWQMWHASNNAGTTGLRYMSSIDGITWADGPNNPVLTQNSNPNAPDYGQAADSVSGYKDDKTYRLMYTGFNMNLFGNQGRFEGICMASITMP